MRGTRGRRMLRAFVVPTALAMAAPALAATVVHLYGWLQRIQLIAENLGYLLSNALLAPDVLVDHGRA